MAVTPYSVTRKVKAKLAITVAVPGLPAPTGTLVIKDGKKTLKKLTLLAIQEGRDHLQAAASSSRASTSSRSPTPATPVVRTSKARLVVKVGR